MNYIDIHTDINVLKYFLLKIDFLKPEENVLSIETPGEGNMNVVLRVITNLRSFILKQSRPFVQKYQDIPAPEDRIGVECQFYNAVTGLEMSVGIPKILGYYPEEYVLILEDLGHCKDLSTLYGDPEIEISLLNKLVGALSSFHESAIPVDYPENRELRVLNHQHMFVLPFTLDNGFSLDTVQEGLEALSLPYKNDARLKEVITRAGEKYLAEGDVLLHGDYYPGSWITREGNVFVIDPEFSFKGFAAFDLGVMAAHFVIASGDKLMISRIKKAYNRPFNETLYYQITGIEIMRRLIGLAQLPLKRTLEEKKRLLDIARGLILENVSA